MNPKSNLRRIVRALLVLTMMTRGYSILNAQVLVTPEQKFEPGYLEAVSTGYDNGTSVPVPAERPAARAEAGAQQQTKPTPAPMMPMPPREMDRGNAMAVKVGDKR